MDDQKFMSEVKRIDGRFRVDVCKYNELVCYYTIQGSSVDKYVRIIVTRYDETDKVWRDSVLCVGTHREMYYRILSIAADITDKQLIEMENL